jgi:DNA repair protein RecO (recombination protein O)
VNRLLGIVVGTIDYGESDRIVHLLTARDGKLTAMARGARKSKRRFVGALEAGNRLDVEVKKGKSDMVTLIRADIDHGRPHIRKSLEGITLAAYLCEFAGGLARGGQPEPRLYGLLDVALLVLDASTEPPSRLFRLAFEAKALTFAGFTPVLDRCAICMEPLSDPVRWACGSGGAVHEHCGSGSLFSSEVAAQLEQARRTPLAELVDAPTPYVDEVFQVHYHWHVGRKLRSAAMLSL